MYEYANVAKFRRTIPGKGKRLQFVNSRGERGKKICAPGKIPWQKREVLGGRNGSREKFSGRSNSHKPSKPSPGENKQAAVMEKYTGHSNRLYEDSRKMKDTRSSFVFNTYFF